MITVAILKRWHWAGIFWKLFFAGVGLTVTVVWAYYSLYQGFPGQPIRTRSAAIFELGPPLSPTNGGSLSLTYNSFLKGVQRGEITNPRTVFIEEHRAGGEIANLTAQLQGLRTEDQRVVSAQQRLGEDVADQFYAWTGYQIGRDRVEMRFETTWLSGLAWFFINLGTLTAFVIGWLLWAGWAFKIIK